MSIRIGSDAAIVKVWEIKGTQSGKSVFAKASSSRKNKDGSYENSSWSLLVVGNALQKIGKLTLPCLIAVTGGEIKSQTYEEKDTGKKRYGAPTIVVYDFITFEEYRAKNVKAKNTVPPDEDDGEDSPY